jgi:pimeloyl-ACP methyl ester carboxylesterase
LTDNVEYTENFPAASPAPASSAPLSPDFDGRVEHRYADNEGVGIHYAVLGEGPLVVMVHGFPDFWYTWRYQMDVLSTSYRVAALDLRGYNRSDKPEGIENYGMNALLGDVEAVIRAEGYERAVIVGHDWGGAISWQFATRRSDLTERLIVLNLPHLSGLTRELANNPEQQKASAYTRFFQQEGAHEYLSGEKLARWASDPDARERYVEAFGRSSFEAMLYYYKRHYPAEPYKEIGPPQTKIPVSTLVIHGLKDPYLLPAALEGTWNWIEKDLTILTVPEAGHFVQQDAAELVARTMSDWLSR